MRYRFGPFRHDTHTGQLTRAGAPLPLQPAALRLLVYFLERPGELLTRERLLSEVWDAVVVDDALSQMLARLRRTLGDSARDPEYIETVPRLGYRFVARVEVDEPAPSSLVGRSVALAALDASGALAVVTGPGGIGKTSLVTEHLRGGGHDAWWVDVAELEGPAAIAGEVARALGVQVRDGDPVALVAEALSERSGRLVLDNVEVAVAAVREVLGAWLGAATRVRFLVASREAPGLPGERVVALEPLSLPASAAVEDVLRSEAVELFVRRARAVEPSFAVDAATASDIAAVVHAVGGLPLGIELAAARLRLFGLEALRERLEAPLDVLSDRRRTPRHARLRDTIAWSWALLEPVEQQVAEALSVFRSPFTTAEAEAVAGPDALDALDGLLDKSLVWRRSDAGVRLGMLEPIRQFAVERLAGAPHRDRVRSRHAALFARFGTPERSEALDREPGALPALASRRSDLAAALAHTLAAGPADTAADLLVALHHVVGVYGPVGSIAARAAEVLALGDLGAPQRVRVLLAAAADLRDGNEREQASERLHLARALAEREVADLVPAVDGSLARLLLQQSRHAEAAARARSALDSDPHGPWQQGRGDWLSICGNAALVAGDLDEARRWYVEALEWEQARDNRRSEAIALANLATVSEFAGEWAEALAMLERSIAMHRECRNDRNEGMTMVHKADVLSALGRHDEALVVLDEALPRLRSLGTRHFVAVASFLKGVVLERTGGDLDEAVVALEEARALASRGRNGWLEASALGQIGAIQARRGLDEGFAALERAVASLRELDRPLELANLLLVQARAELDTGRRGAARARLEEARRAAADNPSLLQQVAELEARLG